MGMEVRCCGDKWGQKPGQMGMDGDRYKLCGNRWGWKSDAAETNGGGNQVRWGWMGTDTSCAVNDGDGLIFHYRAGLYFGMKFCCKK